MSEAEQESQDPRAVRFAIIGDLHDHWNDFDAEHLNASDYDGLFFVGDLGRGPETSRRISRSITRLELPTLVMPGNADAPHADSLDAEFSVRRGMDRLFDAARSAGAAPRDFGGVRLCGYSLHRPRLPGLDFTVIAGRPFSMGGPELTFGPELHARFGIDSLEDSAKRLIDLVDRAETDDLVFLAHNGPHGLGAGPTDPWGCDFMPDGGDWGDLDLTEAIAHARRAGRRVLAVVAGHMHLDVRGHAGERTWLRREDDVLYVNPARVPRIVSHEGGQRSHHVALTLGPAGAEAEEIFVES